VVFGLFALRGLLSGRAGSEAATTAA
jgi:hypothetical protein